MAEAEVCRLDVWLWRARFCKSRGQAGALIGSGRVRLSRGGIESRVDKAARAVRVGDEVVFAVAGRLTAARIEALGTRRGPPAEARSLWRPLDSPPADAAGAGLTAPRIDKAPAGLKDTAYPLGPSPGAPPPTVSR